MKLTEFLEKYADLTQEQKDNIAKVVQGETDAVRTDYSAKIKDLEQYKPKEKTDVEKQLEEATNELNAFKFEKNLKDKGIDANLAKYLRTDADLDEFQKVYSAKKSDNFVPNSVNTTAKEISKSDFQKMDYSQKMSLYQENPQLYAELSN